MTHDQRKTVTLLGRPEATAIIGAHAITGLGHVPKCPVRPGLPGSNVPALPKPDRSRGVIRCSRLISASHEIPISSVRIGSLGLEAGRFACFDPTDQRLPIPGCGLKYGTMRQDGVANKNDAVPLRYLQAFA